MAAIETAYTFPLLADADGVIFIAGSRIPLETVVHYYKAGATPEEIAEDFPSLRLVDVYSVITHYLSHVDEVEQYMAQSDGEAAHVRAELGEIAQSPVRERLLARKSWG
jgi:uncharacterized protein (DUF433 family)